MPNVSRGALWTVYLVVLMDTLNFGIVFPLLPSIADTFGANAAQVGSLATAFSVAQVLCTPLLGRASDRWGRRPVLLISVLGTSLSSAVTGLAWNFPVLVVARIVNGASGASGGIANAYIADVTSGEEKPIFLSYLSAANSIGIIIGPAVGGVLARFGFDVACYVSAGLSAINLVVGLVFLTESRPGVRGQQGADASLRSGTDGASEATPVQTAKIPAKALLLFASAFLFTLGFAAFEAVTGYYLKDTFFHGDATKSGQFYGTIFVIAGVVMFLVAALAYRRMIKCFGERIVVLIGMVFRTAGFSFMSLAPTPVYFALAVMVQVAGSNLIMPTTSSLLTQICDRSIYGRALGYSQASGAIARVVAPIAFGEIYDQVNHKFAFYVNAVAGVLGTLLIVLVPKPPVEELAGPTEEDVEANVDAFERQMSTPKLDDVTPMAPALVRSNSEQLARAVSVERVRRQSSMGETTE